MANFTFAPTATVSINGIVPAAGPTTVDKVTGTYTGATVNVDDRINETFIVNANTIATAINLGKISTVRGLWLQCDGALLVTISQDLGAGPVDVTFKVETFLFIQSTVLGVKVANPSATTAVHMSIIVAGDRPAIGGGPGVF